MTQSKNHIFLNKCTGLQITAIDRFREKIFFLQTRLNDFVYFHINNENRDYSDLTQKSQELYKTTEKILNSIFNRLKVDEDNLIITNYDAISYVKDIYNEVKDEKSIYSTLKKDLKELCKSRNPEEFKEIISASDICLNILGIELNNDEAKMFKNKLAKVFQIKLDSDYSIELDENTELSEEKQILLGQVLSAFCLYISLKLLKKSKSTFKESCKKIDSAYRSEIENSVLLFQNQLTSLKNENEKLKQTNEKNLKKLKEDEIQITELQELLDLKSMQNKKLSNEIMELKGNASSPDIIYKLNDSDSEDMVDTSEILNYLTEPDSNENNEKYDQKIELRNTIPPFVETNTDYNENSKPRILTVPYMMSYNKKKAATERQISINNIDNSNNADNNESKIINDNLLKKDEIIQQKNEIIQQKNETIQQKDEAIQQKDEAIQQKDEKISELNEKIQYLLNQYNLLKKDETAQQKDEIIQNKDEIIQQKDEIIQQKDEKISELNDRFQDLYKQYKQIIFL